MELVDIWSKSNSKWLMNWVKLSWSNFFQNSAKTVDNMGRNEFLDFGAKIKEKWLKKLSKNESVDLCSKNSQNGSKHVQN